MPPRGCAVPPDRSTKERSMKRSTHWERLLARLIEARQKLEELHQLNSDALGK